MLDNLRVVLVRGKYPENVGSAARAMANMGCRDLVLVAPQLYDAAKAAPLATVHAKHILDGARMHDTLAAAVAECHLVLGTTARTGGWRKGILTPDKAGAEVAAALAQGRRVGLVFGPEDKGLENHETSLCTRLVTIPTAPELTSLNLSQAVVILLYECFRAARVAPFIPAGPPDERFITHAEQQTLLDAMQRTLIAVDYLRPDNPDYWMLPLKRFLARFSLKRNEFNLLMGICRQISRLAAGRDAKASHDN